MTSEVDYTKCLCRENPTQDPDWECPIWNTNPDGLGCPVHRPTKQYCRIHHNGFYGDCHPCTWSKIAQALTVVEPEPEIEPQVENQKVTELVAELIDELS